MNAVTRARLARTPPSPWSRVGVTFTENDPGPIGTNTPATGTAAPTTADELAFFMNPANLLQAGIDEPGVILGKVETQAGQHPGLFAAAGAGAIAVAAGVLLLLVLVLRR